MVLGLWMILDRKRSAEGSARVPGMARSWTRPSVWAASGALLLVSGAMVVGVAILRLSGWLPG